MEYEPATAPPGAETTPPAAPPGLGDTAQPPTSTPSSNTSATLDVTAPVMTSAAVAVKREPGTGDSGGYNPNQNQAQFDRVKQETVASAHHDIMNQSAAHSSPKLLPSFSFPPFVPPPSSSSSSPPSTSPPLSSLAPSLFSSSTSSTSSSPSPLPPLSHSPAMATPASAMQSRLSPAPSIPLATSPSSWEQQTLARLNSLTQMTSQIASIALEKTAAKTEAVVEVQPRQPAPAGILDPHCSLERCRVSLALEQHNPESVVEWVTSISRSLQTELQSVYLTLHSGPAEPLSLPMAPVLVLPATAPAPVPTSTLTPALLAPSPASPSVSPLSLSPSLPSFMPGQHFLVQAETVPTPVLMGSPTPISPAQPLAASTEDSGESKKGRRRRKTKTKDSFNHMQRKCASCQRTETTKWRHGPLGSNTLCNTCGLAYSRKKKREAEQAAKLGAAAAAATGSTPSP